MYLKQLEATGKKVSLPQKGGKTILVVDDENGVRRMLNYELTRRGYSVLEASDGKEALAIARENHPDLITMDVLMPYVDGFDTTAVLKNDPVTRDIPILIISIVENKQRGIELGASEFITKPFAVEEVLETVARLVRGNGKRVLVADDDRALVETIKFELEQRGFVPIVAYNGQEAISIIEEQMPDLIILDIVMPGTDGYKVLSQIKHGPETSHVPVIILTGVEIDGGKIKALSLGATEYITKSGGLGRLFEEVENILTEGHSQ